MLPLHLAELFYQLFDDKLSFNEFADQLYTHEAEFEHYMSSDDYLELISFNFGKSYAMYDLHKLMVKYINPGENEKRRLLSYLYDAREKSSKTPFSLEMLYHLYCSGYNYIISLLTDGIIVPLGEKDEIGYYMYSGNLPEKN